MGKEIKQVVAVDVSKASLMECHGANERAKSYANNAKGIQKLINVIKSLSTDLVIVECTGGYEQALMSACWEHEIPVAKVNPGRVRHFCQSKGYLAKTDAIDAKAIYEFGEAMNILPQQQPSAELQAVKQLFLRRQQLQQLIVAEKNHLQAPCADQAVKASIRKVLKSLQREVKQLDSKIAKLIEQVPEMRAKAQALKEEKGVGPVLVAALIALLPEIGTLNRGEVAALVGVAPFNKDSGTASKQRSIRGGRAGIRAVLYMSTLAAIQYNGTIKKYYKSLVQRGMIKMKAVVACMRKFIIHLNSVAKKTLLMDSNSEYIG